MTIDQHLRLNFCLGLGVFCKHLPVSHPFPDAAGSVGDLVLFVDGNTSITTSHKPRAGKPSIRSPASNVIGCCRTVRY